MTGTRTPSDDFSAAADHQRRLRLAGIDGEPPEDIVAFRLQLARHFYMLINRWHGCPELLCRRNRGCMTPHIRCTNIEELPEDEFNRQWYAVKDDLYKALWAHLEEHGMEDM